MRFMGLLKADRDSEAGVPPSPEFIEKCTTFIEEGTHAGVLLATEGLQPSSKGARVRLAQGKVSVIDGPFAETKELIASYALLEAKSMAEVIDWTTRFLKVLGEGECEIRPLYEAGDFGEACSPGEQPGDKHAEQELVRAEEEWGRAMVRNDAEAIGRFMADDWTIIGPDGSMNDKARFLALVKSGALTHDVMDGDEVKVRVYGDAAVVTARGISGGKYQGQPFRVVERVSDVWVRRNGQWRCVSTHLSRLAPPEAG